MPFWSQCDSFVRANLPELVSFGGQCEQSIGSTAVPPPPPVAGGETYLQVTLASCTLPRRASRCENVPPTTAHTRRCQVTLSMQPGSVGTGKAQKRFLSSLRSDIGQALDIVPSAILVDNVQGDSVTVWSPPLPLAIPPLGWVC